MPRCSTAITSHNRHNLSPTRQRGRASWRVGQCLIAWGWALAGASGSVSLRGEIDRPVQAAREAAVHEQNLPGYERGRFGREEDGGADHVLRLADAAERAVRKVPRLHGRLRPELARQVGEDEAGRDGVDADAARAPLEG